MTQSGYRIQQVSGYNVGGVDYYAALWVYGSGPVLSARQGVPDAWFQNVHDNYYYQGYRPAYLTAFASGEAAKVNSVWTNAVFSPSDLNQIRSQILTYMANNNLPGVALAITKDERLVYAAGFGDADTTTGEDAGPANLWRIASVSKPITATTILHLVETRGLSLDAKVFGPGGILFPHFATPAGNKLINQITVRHLLQHSAGFTTSPNDPAFQNTSLSMDDYINWVLNDPPRLLTRTPGSMYEYSNFGYTLLGRVIEQWTGKPYQQYVEEAVLAPCGITDMTIGAETLAGRRAREVRYYPEADAYALPVTRMDAHGGWLASPIDLVRLMVRVDGATQKLDLLSSSTRAQMTTPSNLPMVGGGNSNYGFGWVNNPQSHNGAMRGTGSVMAVLPGGYNVALITNRRPVNDDFSWGLMTAAQNIVNGVSNWPAYDLF